MGLRTPDFCGDLECDDAEYRDVSWFRSEDRHDFHISDDKDVCLKTEVCKICGGDRFLVGSGGYKTAIKCANCGWESVVHEG